MNLSYNVPRTQSLEKSNERTEHAEAMRLIFDLSDDYELGPFN
jgi:hypothetical protein